MKWKNSDTILIYEHRFDEKKHREAHDQMLEGMKQNEKSYEKKRKANKERSANSQVTQSPKKVIFDKELQELQELLEGLE